MAATATAPVADRERLEIIWRTITRDVERFANESGISTVNNKRWTKVDDTLEELGTLLVDEVRDWLSDDKKGTSEVTLLLSATQDIWAFIERRLIDFALEVEAQRAARKAGKAA